MEEKNELNDIILNKSGSGSKSKKLLLAIAALTLILIIVLVIMNSLKSESDEQPPHAVVPPEPSAPTEIIDDPLFEPVEVIQEGSNTTASSEDLSKIAQKIKQESFDTAPVQESVPAAAPVQAAPVAAAPKVEAKPVQSAPAVTAPKAEPKPATKIAAPAAAPQPTPKTVQPVVNTPTIKTVKPAEPKKPVSEPSKPVAETTSKPAQKPVAKTAGAEVKPTETDTGVYYIQVGSFSKQPNQALYERINASGMKYTTKPSGEVTKVLIGPFQGKKSASDMIGAVRKNIEANAFVVKG